MSALSTRSIDRGSYHLGELLGGVCGLFLSRRPKSRKRLAFLPELGFKLHRVELVHFRQAVLVDEA